jgi:hypothetical protein
VVVALAVACGVGVWGIRAYPVSRDDVFLGLIGEQAPRVLACADLRLHDSLVHRRRISPHLW